MNIDQYIVKINKFLTVWLKNPKTQRAFAIAMGFIWGMLVGVVVTLLIIVGV